MKQILVRSAAGFSPGSFSFVMATGIVSIAAFQQQMETTALSLFFLNKITYVVLVFYLVLRGLLLPRELISDMTSTSRAPALFTITAGTCILGSQYLIFSENVPAGFSFWIAGSVFWIVLCYTFFVSAITRREKSGDENEMSGAWLIYVVGTQAVAITTTLLVPYFGRGQEALLLAASCMHAVGIILYVLLIILLFKRMMFLGLPAEKLTPPYWINMGAAAISTLAGAELIPHARLWGFLEEALPALKWTTLGLWAVTTWWVPLIVILNLWRYWYKRFPVSYDVEHWSMVFPLGMYAACTFQFGKAAGLASLVWVSRLFFFIALAAWIVVFAGMAARVFRR